jgi:hypothetical protein
MGWRDEAEPLAVEAPSWRGAAEPVEAVPVPTEKPVQEPGMLERINTGLNQLVQPVTDKIAEVTAPLRRGEPEPVVRPDTAPARAEFSRPREDLDQRALFERRQAIEAEGGKGSPEWRELTKQIARAQSQSVDSAALFLMPAGKGIAGLAERGVKAVDRRIGPNAPVLQAEAETASRNALRDKAIQKVGERFAQDAEAGGLTAQEALDGLRRGQETGKPMTLADLGGENVRGLAGNVARAPGPSRNAMRTFYDERDAAAAARLDQDVAQYVSGGPSMHKTAVDLMEGRATAAAPLYEKAYAANPDMASAALTEVLSTPAGKGALSAARTKMQNDRVPVSEQGANGMSLRTMDYVKRSLDDQIGAARRAGENDQARILTKLKNDFVREVDALDASGGAYAQARAAYAGPSQSLEALEAGRDLFKMKPEQIAQDFAKLSPADQEFFRLGAADVIRERIQKTGFGGDEAKAVIKNSWMQKQLQPIFKTPEDFGRFVDAVTDERRMFEGRREVMGGSQTAGRLAEDGSGMEIAGDLAKGGVNALRSHPMAALGNVMSAYRQYKDLGLRPDPALNLEIAKLVTNPGLAGDSAVMRQLLDWRQSAPASGGNALRLVPPPRFMLLAPGQGQQGPRPQ